MDKGAENRRKNYFIKQKFQRDFILKFCALVVAGSCLSGLIIFRMSGSTLTTAFRHSRLTIMSTADFILPAVLLSSAVVIVLVGLAAIGVTLFASHRIAGPLYRMEKDIQEVARGNLNVRFNLRSTDELKAMASSLDDMVAALRTNVTELNKTVAALEKRLPHELKLDMAAVRSVIDKFKV